ncbi:hypothetical protein [Chryseolinea lacunae]|uniref:Lipoprotein n=1 Tax=Chryseolinea lacunae TaxID=2801331 RepID=A0ABS1KRG8_9BACT|nr:hypothetical protein [Chryseolinea lacunae]MBL0741935.1 hypothetical protein [Chryseolinea lacunae]
MPRVIVAAILLTALLSCAKKKPAEVDTASVPTTAFYYWQTSLGAFDWNDSLAQTMNIRKVYCRFFDVDWSEAAHAPVPVSPLHHYLYDRLWKPKTALVPVVFITNETFKKLHRDSVKMLARNVHRMVMAKITTLTMDTVSVRDYHYYLEEGTEKSYRVTSKRFDEQHVYDSIYQAKLSTIREIQFDCDWTTSTKDKYFSFLTEVKKLFAQQTVTSTIRLYQYKYPQLAGVPPVKRGMLMCYNAGDIRDSKTVNSIFNKKEIMSYLDAGTYPVALDYALPVFSWALLYRNGELKSILSNGELQETHKRHLFRQNKTHYTVTEDFVYGDDNNSLLVRSGDDIRIEEPDLAAVNEVAAWLGEHKNNPEAILSLYQLNNHDLQKHATEIQTLFRSF